MTESAKAPTVNREVAAAKPWSAVEPWPTAEPRAAVEACAAVEAGAAVEGAGSTRSRHRSAAATHVRVAAERGSATTAVPAGTEPGTTATATVATTTTTAVGRHCACPYCCSAKCNRGRDCHHSFAHEFSPFAAFTKALPVNVC